jgi:hypothetical protein
VAALLCLEKVLITAGVRCPSWEAEAATMQCKSVVEVVVDVKPFNALQAKRERAGHGSSWPRLAWII